MSTSDLVKLLSNVQEDFLPFQPNEGQRRARAAFWASLAATEVSLPPHPDPALIAQHGGDRRIRQWWSLPGFQDWFLNRDEFRQRVEYLADLALGELEGVLISRAYSPSDKLGAIKLVMQIAQKTPSTQKAGEGFLDQKIAQMNKQQLEEYIKRNVKLLEGSQLTPTEVSDILVK